MTSVDSIHCLDRRKNAAEDKAAQRKDDESADPYHALNLNSNRQTQNGTQGSTGG